MIRAASKERGWNGKIWGKFSIRIDPSSDDSELLEFRNYLKLLDQIQNLFKLRTYGMVEKNNESTWSDLQWMEKRKIVPLYMFSLWVETLETYYAQYDNIHFLSFLFYP